MLYHYKNNCCKFIPVPISVDANYKYFYLPPILMGGLQACMVIFLFVCPGWNGTLGGLDLRSFCAWETTAGFSMQPLHFQLVWLRGFLE